MDFSSICSTPIVLYLYQDFYKIVVNQIDKCILNNVSDITINISAARAVCKSSNKSFKYRINVNESMAFGRFHDKR